VGVEEREMGGGERDGGDGEGVEGRERDGGGRKGGKEMGEPAEGIGYTYIPGHLEEWGRGS
jgi:hypothetical protein